MQMKTYPKHEKALASAMADIGVQEQPPGSNRGPRVQTYQHATWLGGTGWPWCVAFWLYHTLQAGLEMPYKGPGAYRLLEWADKQGWTVPAGDAMVGDAVVFELGAGHVGMLRDPIRRGKVRTVDGNISDRVDIRERPIGQVRGIVHVPEAARPVPALKAPVFEVVGSVSGHKKVLFAGRRGTVAKWIAETPIGPRYGGVTIRRRKT